MPTARGSVSWREGSARRLLLGLRRRTALNEGVGVLQSWNLCDQDEARHRLLVDHGRGGSDAEAHRMIAIVEATANGRTDPDAHWD